MICYGKRDYKCFSNEILMTYKKYYIHLRQINIEIIRVCHSAQTKLDRILSEEKKKTLMIKKLFNVN